VLISSFDISKFVGTPGMRLGDINGDGKMEIVMGQPEPQPGASTPQQVVCVTAYDLKGNQLWQYGTPGTSTERVLTFRFRSMTWTGTASPRCSPP